MTGGEDDLMYRRSLHAVPVVCFSLLLFMLLILCWSPLPLLAIVPCLFLLLSLRAISLDGEDGFGAALPAGLGDFTAMCMLLM